MKDLVAYFFRLISSVKGLLVRLVRRLPIVSGLPDVKSQSHFDALGETVITVVLATIPIWLGAFIAALLDNSSFVEGGGGVLGFIFNKFRATLDSGVLIIYASSLVSPILYMALNERRGSGGIFPSKKSHVVVVLAVSVIAAGYYTASSINPDLNVQIVRDTSIFLFCFSFFVLYVASCYRHEMNRYEHSSVVNAGAKNFARSFRDFRSDLGGNE